MSFMFGDWRAGRVAITTAYIDTSGDRSEIAVAPAAVIASPELWEEFDRRWNSCLKDFGVTSLHMKHFAHFRGEFEGWKFETNKRARLLNHLLWIIEDLLEYACTCAVLNDEYRYLDRNYCLSETIRPYSIGCLICAGLIASWAKSKGHDKNDLIWIFEKGDQDQSEFKKHWSSVYPDRTVEPSFMPKTIKNESGQIVRRIRPFEAADLIAYEHLQAHKLLKEKQELGVDAYEDELRRPMRRMKNWEWAKKWKVCDIPSLELLCETWKIPLREGAV